MIQRPRYQKSILRALREYPVALLLGTRQCGKTTLARQIHRELGGHFFDLEDPACPVQPDTARLVLQDLEGLVVIDEVQRQPDLFSLIRVLADRQPTPARFLLLGSAAPDLVKGASETLAGRVGFQRLTGFSLDEVDDPDALWVRGGLPDSYLAADESASFVWRTNFAQSFLERDIPQLGIRIPSTALRRFWTMVAHYHGQVWNGSDFSRSLGVKEDTARRYLDILTGAYVIRQLLPWHENTGKRVVKSPKVYLTDSGMLHNLLRLSDRIQVQSHPKLGASWEGFALEQVLSLTGGERDAYFYRTHGGAELDLLLTRDGRRVGFEFKYADRPPSTKSMHIVMNDLSLDRLLVVHPGDAEFPLANRIQATPIKSLVRALDGEALIS